MIDNVLSLFAIAEAAADAKCLRATHGLQVCSSNISCHTCNYVYKIANVYLLLFACMIHPVSRIMVFALPHLLFKL